MNLLKKIDIFGTKFNFTIFGNSHYNTKFGGVLTFITVALSMAVTFIFGNDLLFRKNPKVITEKLVPVNYSFNYYNVSNFPFFWTLKDSLNNLVNFTDILYPVSKIYVYKYNTTTSQLVLNDAITLPNKKCTKDMVNNDDLFIKLGLNLYYCIDWTDSPYPFGGFWDGTDSLYNFEQTLYFCPNDNRTSENCTDFLALKNFLGQANKIYYDIYYSNVYFSPNNYDKALNSRLINSYHEISSNLYKKCRYFFTEAMINSDKGWIFDSITNKTLITIDDTNYDVDFKSDDDLNNKNMTSGIYSTTIYMMKNHDSYNISYMKVQDLAAQIGGFMKIIMVFFVIINFFFNQFSRDLDVMNKIYEIKKLDEKKLDEMKLPGLKEFMSKRRTCKQSINNSV